MASWEEKNGVQKVNSREKSKIRDHNLFGGQLKKFRKIPPLITVNSNFTKWSLPVTVLNDHFRKRTYVH